MTKKKRRIFELKEANALVPEIKDRVKHLQTKKETYTRLHDTLFMHELVSAAEQSNGFFEKDDLEASIHGLEQAIEDLAKDVEAIFQTGCILRNIEKGIVEFPAIFEGKPVFWSWQLGEPEIRYYRCSQSALSSRLLISSGA